LLYGTLGSRSFGLSALGPLRRSGVPFYAVCEYTTVTKLFVGNLPFTATEASVRTLFAAHGTVETVALITDRDTGRPRGFGFVEVSSADASRAIDALNGKDFEGRALKVNEAQERERSGGARR
jgi:RNA recognition motif-containing protein